MLRSVDKNKPGPNNICFGPFALNLRAGELLNSGRKVVVQEQPIRVLRLLLEHAGEVVSREELRRTLWPNDTVVEFDHGINTAIRKLRLALGDSADGPLYIETVGRRGYRFIAQLESMGDEHAPEPYVSAGASPESPESPEAWRNLIGRKVTHYRVLDLAGGGGMGLVYRAEDIRLGRRVALKFLPGELARDAVAVQRFEQEARAASALDHRNICPLYEFGEYEDQAFIVMPFLEGRTLRHRLDAAEPPCTGLPENELLNIAIQIAEGLDAAHRRGIIHRDVKPANVFLTVVGEVKILDFGISKLVEAAEEFDPNTNRAERPLKASLTVTGATVGTASYMSPEQIRREKIDPRTDLFSFGLVLYEMATGRQAFSGETAADVREAILRQSPARPRTGVSAALWTVIAKATEKGRENRYQTASEMRDALLRLQRNTGARPKQRIRRWLGLCGIGLGAVIAVAFRHDWGPPVQHPALVQRKLTTTSVDNHVLAGAAISPDGTRLAYSEREGMRVKLLETGETRSVPQPLARGQDARWAVGPWFPDGSRFIANARPAGQDAKQWSADGSSIWAVPGGTLPPYKLRDQAEAFSISPDGKLIAFGANAGAAGDREIWVMNAAGGDARKLYEAVDDSVIGGLQWSPDGRRVLYLRTDRTGDTFITRLLEDGPSRALLSIPPSRLHDYLWLADGRLLYILSDPGPVDDSCNIWRTRIEPHTGQLADKPEQATSWAGFCLDSLSATADAKQLVVQRWASESNVFIAKLEDNGMRLGALTRLTTSDNYNNPLDWTADGAALIVASNRNGRWGLFRHSINSDAMGSLVTRAEGPLSARVTPDGHWILYVVSAKNGSTSAGTGQQVMRISPAGGVPVAVIEGQIAGLSCPRSGDSCAIAEQPEGAHELVFTTVHPIRGRGRELARFAIDPAGRYQWDLSPDGTRIAFLRELHSEIDVLAVNGPTTKTIAVKGTEGLQNLFWRADGLALLSSTQMRGNAVLLSIDLLGNSTVLWEQPGVHGTYAVPARDGRYLAILDSRTTNNIWMLENF